MTIVFLGKVSKFSSSKGKNRTRNAFLEAKIAKLSKPENWKKTLVGPGCFNNLKEPTVVMKEPAMIWQLYGWLFDFSQNFKNCDYIPELGF
jgi:hypothetical protein